MSEAPKWTPEMLAEFDDLTWMVSSRDQVERITGRTRMNAFVEKHGKEVCDAMWAKLQTEEE